MGLVPLPHEIRLSIVGLPAPKGSVTRLPNGGYVHARSPGARKGSEAWGDLCRQACADWRAEHPGQPIDEAVAVSIVFGFPLPKSDPYRSRHTSTPDIDKLARHVLDSLVTGGLLRDDSLVFKLDVVKLYARYQSVGAEVTIVRHGADEAAQREQLKNAAAQARRAPKVAAEQGSLVRV